MVPIWLDAGVAINDGWYVDAYFQFGVGSTPSPSRALHEWLIFGVRRIVDLSFTPSRHREPPPVETSPPEVTDPDAQDPEPDKTEQPSNVP